MDDEQFKILIQTIDRQTELIKRIDWTLGMMGFVLTLFLGMILGALLFG